MSQPTIPPAEGETHQPVHHQRRQKLVKAGIQLRMSGIFAGLTIVCLLLQWLLFSALLTTAANQMPVGSEYLLDLVPTLLGRSILLSVALALPLTILVGILTTFRITGPIYRFESYLRGVIRGTQLGPCKIREGDALGELCTLINEATEPVRRRQVQGGEGAPEGEAA